MTPDPRRAALRAEADRLAADGRQAWVEARQARDQVRALEAENARLKEQTACLARLLSQAQDRLRSAMSMNFRQEGYSEVAYQANRTLVAAIDQALYPEAADAPEPEPGPPVPDCEEDEPPSLADAWGLPPPEGW